MIRLAAMAASVLMLGGTIRQNVAPAPVSGLSVWQVVVLPLDMHADEPDVYWVGLKNVSSSDRAFCRLGIYYEVDLRNGDTVSIGSDEYPAIGSPHPCPQEAGTLVLAGQTHFVTVRVKLPKDAVRPKKVRFEIVAQESCVRPKCGVYSPIIVAEPAGE